MLQQPRKEEVCCCRPCTPVAGRGWQGSWPPRHRCTAAARRAARLPRTRGGAAGLARRAAGRDLRQKRRGSAFSQGNTKQISGSSANQSLSAASPAASFNKTAFTSCNASHPPSVPPYPPTCHKHAAEKILALQRQPAGHLKVHQLHPLQQHQQAAGSLNLCSSERGPARSLARGDCHQEVPSARGPSPPPHTTHIP